MRLRPLGKTSISVSELALGTWGLSGDGYGAVPDAEQDRVIERARALGVTTFETADCYAAGDMERRLGKLLPDDGKTVVITKIGTDRDASPPRKRFDVAYLREALERSRDRLDRRSLDVVLLHGPSAQALGRDDLAGALDEWREAGLFRAWGVSAGGTEVARAALNRGVQVLSLAYNLLHASDLLDLAAAVRQEQTGIIAHSVLAYGLLAGHWSSEKTFAPGDHRADRWTPDELRRRLRQLSAIRPAVSGTIGTLRAVALRYVLQNDLVGTAVIGPKNQIQLDQLVREAGKQPPYLPPERLNALQARLRDHGVNI